MFSKHAAALPPPPASSNWSAEVGSWGMLANNQVGNCVWAAILHMILQQASYAQAPAKPRPPTAAEAISVYSAATGYVPGRPATDLGTYMMGKGGAAEFWTNTGVKCGGVLNKPQAILQVSTKDTTEWRQAIHIFGSMLVGIALPQSIENAEEPPFVWSDPSGPSAGGHEIIVTGYLTVANGVLYEIVSWGQVFRVTEAFLLATIDEALCVYDRVSLDARGVSPAGLSEAVLLADMDSLRAA